MTPLPGDVPAEEWALTRLLVTASRLVEHDISRRLRPHGLTHAGFGVLALVRQAPMSQRDIASATRVEEQTISRTIDRLERLDMVTRERDPHDRRRFLVTPTRKGLRTWRAATRHDLAEDLLGGLPEADALRAALTTLIRRLGAEGHVPLPQRGAVGEPPARASAPANRRAGRRTH